MAFENVVQDAKRLPWWAWAGGAVAIVLVGAHFLGGNSSTSASGDSGGTLDTSGGSGDTGDMGTPGPTTPTSTGSPTGTTGTTTTTGGTGTITQTSKTYVVRSGDTLNSIASKYHVDEPALYSLNQSTIEATAHAHNMPSRDGGWWIFPGEILKIPA